MAETAIQNDSTTAIQLHMLIHITICVRKVLHNTEVPSKNTYFPFITEFPEPSFAHPSKSLLSHQTHSPRPTWSVYVQPTPSRAVPTPWTCVHLDTMATSLCYCWGIHTPAFLIHMAYAPTTILLISRTSSEKVAYKLLSTLKTTSLSQYTNKNQIKPKNLFMWPLTR